MYLRLMRVGEGRDKYLRIARSYARDRFNFHRKHLYRSCHYSFAVEAALMDAQRKFPDLGTFGVEGDCTMNGEGHIDIQYLNAGDTYAATICFWRGSFVVSSWGDLVESVMK